MKRYVIKKDKQWKVVSSKYKKSSKNFDNRLDAIKFAYSAKTTSSLIIQGDDNKFTRLTQSEIKSLIENGKEKKITLKGERVKSVPRYVYVQNGDAKSAKNRLMNVLLSSLIGIFVIVALVFMTLYLLDWKDIK